MDIGLIRLLDRKFGDLLIRVILAFGKPKDKLRMPPDKLLVIKIWGMGSVINLSPTLAELKKKYPDAKIDFLTAKQNLPLYKNNQIFNNIYTIDISKGFPIFIEMLKKILLLRRNKYDLLFDFEPLANSTALFTRIISAKKSVGFYFGHKKRKNLFTDTVFYEDKKEHISVLFYSLLGAVGIQKSKMLELVPPKVLKNEKNKVLSFLSKKKIKKYICINVNASSLALQRRWPQERFSKLSKMILKEFPDYFHLFIGGPDDVLYVDECIGEGENKIINIAGKFSILETAFILERSKLLITNDSGPLHLAAAVGCPTISFFGPETPRLYGPRNSKSKVFYKGLQCSPCIDIRNAKKVNCSNPICLDFSVEEIFAEAKKILKN